MIEINKKNSDLLKESAEFNKIQVIKRDGRVVEFEEWKITNALLKAERKINGTVEAHSEARIQEIVDMVIEEILQRFNNNVKIYEIQNIVEHTLLDNCEYDLAKEYINYRTSRDFERSRATDINFTISKLLNKDSQLVNENANKDSDVFNTQRDLTAGIVGKSIGCHV